MTQPEPASKSLACPSETALLFPSPAQAKRIVDAAIVLGFRDAFLHVKPAPISATELKCAVSEDLVATIRNRLFSPLFRRALLAYARELTATS